VNLLQSAHHSYLFYNKDKLYHYRLLSSAITIMAQRRKLTYNRWINNT